MIIKKNIERIKNYNKAINNYRKNNKIKKFNSYCIDKNPHSDFSKHIIICGEPRGGTTWLMELLKNKNDTIIWEPIHFHDLKAYSNKFYNQLGFVPYIPEDVEWDEAKLFFQRLFSGQLPHGLWKNYDYDNTKLIKNNSLVIKFCRANLVLPWLLNSFSNLRPIYLIRHPLSVISSQFRHPKFTDVGTIHNYFEIRKKQNPLFNDIFDKHKDKINNIKSREELFANWWSISNLLALKINNNRCLTVSYESLYEKPFYELDRIASHLNMSIDRFSTDSIKKPSSTTELGSGILENKSQLSNFKRHLTKSQIREILDIVHSYGIDCYNDDVKPKISKIYNN